MSLISTPPATEVPSRPVQKPVKQPKGWVRWSGLMVFLAIVGGVFGVSYLGLSYGLKKQIEHYATDAWGAKVDIGSLGFELSPLSVNIGQVALTDPDKPMENLISIGNLHASLSLYHWVVGRTVIEDLSFRDFKMHQPRKTSGAIVKSVKPMDATNVELDSAKQASTFEMPKMNLPDPSNLLQRETLETMQSAQKVQAQLAEIDQAWSKLQAKLPSESAIKDYQKRFEDLTKGDFKSPQVILAKKQAFEDLKKEIEAQKTSVEDAQRLLAQLDGVKTQTLALKSLPEKDYQRLMAKYDLSTPGVSNITYLLFGPKIQDWLETGRAWYEKLRPVIQKVQALQAKQAAEAELEAAAKVKRSFGVEVAYREYDPEPTFMIKRIHGDAVVDWGQIMVGVNNVNIDQVHSKKPVTFKIVGTPQGQSSPLTIVGQSNYVNSQSPVNRAEFDLQNYALRQWVLSGDKNLPVVMQQGDLAVNGDLSWLGGQQVRGVFDATFNQVALDASQSNSAEVKKYLAPIFADVQKFTVKTGISGNILAPKLDAKSDLDSILSKAFNQALDRELAAAKQEVKKQLDLLLAEQLAPINQQLASLLGNQKILDAQGISLDKILKGELPSVDIKQIEKQAQKSAEDAVKKEAEKVLQDKMKGLLKGFGF